MTNVADYYEGLEKAVKVSPEYKKLLKLRAKIVDYSCEEQKDAITTMEEFYRIYFLVMNPLLNMLKYRFQRRANPDELEKIKHSSIKYAKKYRTTEIYQILCGFYPEAVQFVIDEITEEPGSAEDLITAIGKRDEELFKKTLRNGHCKISDSANKLIYFFNNCDIRGLVTATEDCWRGNKNNMGDSVALLLSSVPISEKDKSLAVNLFVALNEGSWAERLIASKQELDITKDRAKELYWTILGFELLKGEQSVLEGITSQPEVSEYFKEWKAEHDEEVMKQVQQEAESDVEFDADEKQRNNEHTEQPEKAIETHVSQMSQLIVSKDDLLFRFGNHYRPTDLVLDANYAFDGSHGLAVYALNNKEKIEIFVTLMSRHFGYIEGGKRQAKAFVRTITGIAVDRTKTKPKLKSKEAVRAILYMAQQGILPGKMCDCLDKFDLGKMKKTPKNQCSTYAQRADDEFQKLVIDTFGEYMESQKEKKRKI